MTDSDLGELDIINNDPLYLNKSTPVFMITLPQSYAGQYYRNVCKASWERFGYNVIEVPAMTEEECKFYESEIGVDYWNMFQPKKPYGVLSQPNYKRSWYATEKMAFMSHIKLWEELVYSNTDAFIIEHDCKLIRDFPQEFTHRNFRPFTRAMVHDPLELKKHLDGEAKNLKGLKARPKHWIKPSTGYWCSLQMAAKCFKTIEINGRMDEDLNTFLMRIGDKQGWSQFRYKLFDQEAGEVSLELQDMWCWAVEEFNIEFGKTVKDGTRFYIP